MDQPIVVTCEMGWSNGRTVRVLLDGFRRMRYA